MFELTHMLTDRLFRRAFGRTDPRVIAACGYQPGQMRQHGKGAQVRQTQVMLMLARMLVGSGVGQAAPAGPDG